MTAGDGRSPSPATRPRLLATTATLLLLITTLPTAVRACEKEISDDVCPQREGFDKDCENHCQQAYPHRLASGCYLRNTGTLLSFFGIKSFVCKCRLPEQFCADGSTPATTRGSFSLQDLTYHSSLVPLLANPVCLKPMMPTLTCNDEFGQFGCGWQRSVGADWYVAQPHSPMPFADGEAPTHRYLVGVAKGGSGSLWLDTCPGLCSRDTVNVTARIWRGPWVNAELCFREEDAIMCAPLRISNGKPIREVIPQTSHFQISIKFTNVSDGDVVLMDDVSARFSECPIPPIVAAARVPKSLDSQPQAVSPTGKVSEIITPLGTSIKKSVAEQLQEYGVEMHHGESLRRKLCKQGDCTTIVHHPSKAAISYEKLCMGRLGLLQCREKCINDGAEGKMARCVRQRNFPLNKRCLCQLRRAPMKRVDGGSRQSPRYHVHKKSYGPRNSSADFNWAQVAAQQKTAIEQEIVKNAVLADDNVCERENADELCDESCKSKNSTGSGRCHAEGERVVCRCSACTTISCDFETPDCEWISMGEFDSNFGNFSIASKKNYKNRYGLSHVIAGGYSGLVRRGPLQGPISLFLDVYPTEGIDVRICINSLSKCQTQLITPKSWNRVRAKIKVKKAERIFMVFANSAVENRTMALDNISLTIGQC
ncbi:hypothetical protein Q1695_007626 [Nippostrongylus brasiliensis]|nr:hypothetical protein Q1695_007626 [Nippostrongylus brasiliensis]